MRAISRPFSSVHCRRFFAIPALAGSLCLCAVRAKADSLVYSNGDISTSRGAYSISSPYAVTDSFTVGSNSILTYAEAGIWTLTEGTAPNQVNWAIGTTPFSSQISSGTSDMVSKFESYFDGSYTVWEDSFSIGGTVSPGTTYYLTLSGATTRDGSGTVEWDANNGPSTAQQSVDGASPGSAVSESFSVYGNSVASAVPEPSRAVSLAGLFGIGLAAFAWRRRKLIVRAPA